MINPEYKLRFVGFREGPERTPEEVAKCVGEGWKQIVIELIEELKQLSWDGALLQVKEKFGGLRFYIGRGNEQIWKAIDKAESKSLRTCEDCGEPGIPRDGGWIRTLCEDHWQSS